MVWGLGLRSRLLAAAGVTVFMAAYPHVPAKAADLGGDCCADLEDRIAELEATTVRKGNKKVSVTLYGQVNKSVLWWDDGAEKNTYVVDNNYEQRFSQDRRRLVGWLSHGDRDHHRAVEPGEPVRSR
jgi:hypothetical protein